MCQGQGGMPSYGQGFGGYRPQRPMGYGRGYGNAAPQGMAAPSYQKPGIGSGFGDGAGMGFNGSVAPQQTGGDDYRQGPQVTAPSNGLSVRPPMTPDMFGPRGDPLPRDGRMYAGGSATFDETSGMRMAPDKYNGDPYGLSTGGNPSQPFMPGAAAPQQTGGVGYANPVSFTAPTPGGWNPSFGGAPPSPFLGSNPSLNPANVGSQPYAPTPAQAPAQPNPQAQYQAWQRENASLIRPQQDMGFEAWNAQNPQAAQKLAPNTPPTQPPAQPPMPTGPLQPGQAGWVYGNNPFVGQVRTDYSRAWQPQWNPGANEYIGRMLGNGQGSGFAPWVSQINWQGGNVLDQIGQLSGNKFNPSQWSY